MASGVLAPSQPGVATACATWYHVRGANDSYWRVQLPADAIGAKVIGVPDEQGLRAFTEPNLDTPFRWIATYDGAEYPDHEGQAAVFTRPDPPRAVHAAAMSANGIRTVAEVDDNYLSDLKFNIFTRQTWRGGERERHLEAFASFDAIITTTPWLQDEYRTALIDHARAVGKKLALPDFYVCGNHVDPQDWPAPVPRDGRLRVGWMGSPSHLWDVKLAYPALHWAASAGHEVVLIGYDPQWFPQTQLRRVKLTTGGYVYRGWNRMGFEYTMIPWVDPREFKRSVYPLDIALIPLLRNHHTLGKSDVKFLEMSMSGAATIASNIEVYSGTIRHGETGVLAGGREEMLHWTQRLCREERLRAELASAAREYVLSERTIDRHAHEWRAAVLGGRP